MERFYNLPSVKTLKGLSTARAVDIRKILECESHTEMASLMDSLEIRHRLQAMWMSKNITFARLMAADVILQTSGVESIAAGRNRKSPAIWYCNAGDTYRQTLMYVDGKGYKVGCWGGIVERGNYE
jgi:hypothetical protein